MPAHFVRHIALGTYGWSRHNASLTTGLPARSIVRRAWYVGHHSNPPPTPPLYLSLSTDVILALFASVTMFSGTGTEGKLATYSAMQGVDLYPKDDGRFEGEEVDVLKVSKYTILFWWC